MSTGVKDVPKSGIGSKSEPILQKATLGNQVSLKSLSARSLNTARTDSVNIGQKSLKRLDNTSTRKIANSSIDAVNFVSSQVSGIADFVKGLSGIVAQASDESLSNDRRKALEREANQLVEAIKLRANTPAPTGELPLAGDEIKFDLEDKIGKTLEVMLPEDASKAFGIGVVQFTTKDTIIKTRNIVADAKTKLANLQQAVSSVRDEVTRTIAELEVAMQNGEATRSSIRDVEGALEISDDIRKSVKLNPKLARDAVGSLHEENAMELLNPQHG